jgi:hypothetical protein
VPIEQISLAFELEVSRIFEQLTLAHMRPGATASWSVGWSGWTEKSHVAAGSPSSPDDW